MQKILATKTASLTDLRDPMKVIEAAGGSPIAIMNRNKIIGYFVPESSIHESEPRYATKDEILKAIDAIKTKAQPVLDYLKDK